MPEPDIYDPGFIAALFDEMSATYGVTNYISSFGFCERWRRQAVEGVPLVRGARVVEMMSGSGECWRFLERRLGANSSVLALDLSSEMCRRARDNRRRFPRLNVEVQQGDALASGIANESADHVMACFGLKTFSEAQLATLAREVRRVLKPGGTFSFVEIGMPSSLWLRVPYLFYLRHVIPVIGRAFLGNPDNYRMLSVYTERFEDGDHVRPLFEREGFDVRADALFFGCARRLVGARGRLEPKPDDASGAAWLLASFVFGALLGVGLLLFPFAVDYFNAYFGHSYYRYVVDDWVRPILLSAAVGGTAGVLAGGLVLWLIRWARRRAR